MSLKVSARVSPLVSVVVRRVASLATTNTQQDSHNQNRTQHLPNATRMQE